MCTLGAFLISLEGVKIIHLLLKTLKRHQDVDGNKSPVLDNLDSLSCKVCVFVTRTFTSYSSLFSIDVRVCLSCWVESVERLPVLEVYALIILQLWCVCSCDNYSHIYNIYISIWLIQYFLIFIHKN